MNMKIENKKNILSLRAYGKTFQPKKVYEDKHGNLYIAFGYSHKKPIKQEEIRGSV